MDGNHDIQREQPYHKRTQCEVHREIYRDLKRRGISESDPVITKLRDAYDMGKKLNNKLRQYRYNYDDQWWEDNKLAGGEISDADDDQSDDYEITGTPV
jgi:hypothetical protein